MTSVNKIQNNMEEVDEGEKPKKEHDQNNHFHIINQPSIYKYNKHNRDRNIPGLLRKPR